MKHSESIAALSAALVEAQADIRAVEKSAVNPHFKSKYVPLDAIVAMTRPALAKHGLAVAQSAEPSADGNALLVESMLVHTSGEWLSNAVHIPLAKKDPQGAGAAVTYGRRFGLSSLLGITSEEDDDGNSASRPAAAPKRAEKPAVPPTAPVGAVRKPDEDKMWGGKTLGEHTKDELNEIIHDFKNDPKPALKALVTACRNVLTNRSLGMTPAVEDVDANVKRMKDAVDRETAPLGLG